MGSLLQKDNGDTLTIDEYNMVLKTMRTIEGVENVLGEISNLFYDVDFNEDTYFILMNFYFNCGFVSRGKDFLRHFEIAYPTMCIQASPRFPIVLERLVQV